MTEDTRPIDLHTHSTASDGSVAPERIPLLAEQAGLSAVALTDHDTTGGLQAFLDAARGHDITAVPGVEFSTRRDGKEFHIVGLFINPADAGLADALAARRAERDARNLAMLEKLRAGGFELTLEELRATAGGESIGRPHMATLLVKKGYFPTLRDAFEHCLKQGTPYYVPREGSFQPADAIRIIHAAGGLAVWAHPIQSPKSGRSYLRKFLKILIPDGLDGMETHYSQYSPKQELAAVSQAREFNILESGGSDFHGENQPGVSLGTGRGALRVPREIFDRMREKLGR